MYHKWLSDIKMGIHSFIYFPLNVGADLGIIDGYRSCTDKRFMEQMI